MTPVYQPRLRTNIAANFLGHISNLLIGILFTPLYIYYLGIEAYGLIGFYITLQGSLAFLEMGLSRACSRELARYSGIGDEGIIPMRKTLRTLEVVYWLVALLIGSVLTLLAPFIAEKWITTNVLTQSELTHIIITIAWVIALRWPIGVYQGALMGLQRHIKLNLLQVGLSLLSGGGVILILAWLDATITSYFRWQLFAVAVGFLLFSLNTWQVMPRTRVRPHFSFPILKNIYHFAAGVGATEILGTVLKQADKLILSGLLPMKQFAYYALASLIAQTLAMVAGAISNAIFPRFTQMIGINEKAKQLIELYHFSSQLVAILIIPTTLALVFYSYEVLYVYTGNHEIANQTALVLTILVIANMLHASMVIPYAMQLAHGWVQFSIWVNVVSVIWLIPALHVMVPIYGTKGAAVAWLLVTLGYVFISLPLMHRKLLPGEAGQWFKKALLKPALITATYFIIVDYFVSLSENRWILAIEITTIGIISLIFTSLTIPFIRQQFANKIHWRTT